MCKNKIMDYKIKKQLRKEIKMETKKIIDEMNGDLSYYKRKKKWS